MNKQSKQKIIDGSGLWGVFDSFLASYAQKNALSFGRLYPEVADSDRLAFQRDRDRIIHTASFRRLKGKMQVVSPGAGDHFRNRLSHTLEVSQIARDLARHLRLNEDLAEAIALAHDLGHPPFGHAGEAALDVKMREFGLRFDHNKQSLRVVTVFEKRYSDFPGLNLTREVLEGIQKHEDDFDRPDGEKIFWPHLEAQVVDIADEIAYLSADLEDGLRGEFFVLGDLFDLELVSEAFVDFSDAEKKCRDAVIRRVIGFLFHRLVADTTANLEKFNIKTLADVQCCEETIVFFSADFLLKFRELKRFLREKYYHSPVVERETDRGKAIIFRIFDRLMNDPGLLPDGFLVEEVLERRVCDYVAGMTDEFAYSVDSGISVQ